MSKSMNRSQSPSSLSPGLTSRRADGPGARWTAGQGIGPAKSARPGEAGGWIRQGRAMLGMFGR